MQIPDTVRNPHRVAEQAIKHWPNRKALKDRGITVIEVREGVECNPPKPKP